MIRLDRFLTAWEGVDHVIAFGAFLFALAWFSVAVLYDGHRRRRTNRRKGVRP